MITFILITGYCGTGKTTVANDIKNMLESHDYRCETRSFATPLKELASIYFNYDESKKDIQRQLLEDLARNLKELFGKELFAHTLLDKCPYVFTDYVIVDDLRYIEEYRTINEFFRTAVIKVMDPDLSNVDENDLERIHNLTEYFDTMGVPYFQMKSRNLYGLKKFILGLK